MEGVTNMLTKIKMFIIKAMDDFYMCMYEYWMEQARGFAQLKKYDKVDNCQELATKYLIKEANLLAKAIKLA